MLARLVFLLVAALAIFSWLWRLFGSGREGAERRFGPQAGPRGRGGAAGAPPATDRMVRDRVCNTFLPRSRALRLEVGSEEHFFCSAACRDSFLARD